MSREIQTHREWIFMTGYVSVRKPASTHMVLTAAPIRIGSNSQRMDIHVSICTCDGTYTNIHGSYHCSYPAGLSQRVAINVMVCICEGTCTNIHVSCSPITHMVLTTTPVRSGSNSQRVAIHVTVCICEGICSNTHGSYLLLHSVGL